MNTLNLRTSNIIKNVLPTIAGGALTYNALKNVYLTMGYTSLAGNTYYGAIRISENLAVKYSLGQGYKYTFLNGITLYGYDGTKTKVLANRLYNCFVFSEVRAKQMSIQILYEFLQGQSKLIGGNISTMELRRLSEQMISNLECKRLS